MRFFFLLDPKLLIFGFSITFFASYGQTFFISIYNLQIRSFYKNILGIVLYNNMVVIKMVIIII